MYAHMQNWLHVTHDIQSSSPAEVRYVKKKGNVPSQLLLIRQWPNGNSCTWAHDVQLTN